MLGNLYLICGLSFGIQQLETIFLGYFYRIQLQQDHHLREQIADKYWKSLHITYTTFYIDFGTLKVSFF